ncbi:GntR family transcriptional regulator [Microbacterium sp. LWH7-1.2]|jgi:DNA-binding GntR family transcriptional regulator|uniref:GntR family transcriptional regulator n=1 Tax=Microbacterium sp. LWH7-1.2 TaxID=3135257 RepID=UPI003139A24F
MSAIRGRTLVEAIREMVIAGELAPGSRVTEPLLAKRFGVSRVPVREALRVLAAEGFIDLRPYGSPTVQVLTDDVVREVNDARNLLEPNVAREAALHRRDADLVTIRSILTEGDEAIAERELHRLNRMNSRFHNAVASACGNSVLGAFVHVLSNRSEWINVATIAQTSELLWADHREIYAAIARGDAPLAEALMAAHVRRATSVDLRTEPAVLAPSAEESTQM